MNASDFISIVVNKLASWYDSVAAHLPNIALAIVVLILFIILSKFTRKFAKKVISRSSDNQMIANLGSIVAGNVIIITGIFYALGILKLDSTVSSLLAGAGIMGLALGFAFRDLTANFISGIFIAIQRPINVGDMIETNGFFGTVKEIKIRSTILDNFAGQEIEVPSARIYENPITNYTKTGERRLQIDCGVSYNDDLEEVQRIALEAINQLPFVRQDKPAQFHFKGFGDSSINFYIWYWLDMDVAGAPLATGEVVKALKKAFDANNITIPFPIRTLAFSNAVEVKK